MTHTYAFILIIKKIIKRKSKFFWPIENTAMAKEIVFFCWLEGAFPTIHKNEIK